VHTKYAITENLIARASYSQTIGRPSISTLLQEEDINYNTRRITAANLGIKPQSADNLDLVLEYYFEPVGIVSVNYFQKNIKNFIQSYNYDITDAASDIDGYGPEFYYTSADQAASLLPWRVSGRRNSGDGKVRGFEFAYQQQFSFLPGPFKRLSGFANYTYIETESQKGGTSESGSLTNFVPQLLNAGLSWRGNGLDIKLRYNWTDDYLREDATLPINREYNAATGRYDLNVSYSINRNVSLYFDIFNMFNSHEQFYVGGKEVDRPIYITRDEDNGTRYSFGARIRL
jgi:TonB-dependent receptor